MGARAITVLAVAAIVAAGCGSQTSGPSATTTTPGAARVSSAATTAPSATALPQGHPHVVQPVAGAAARVNPGPVPAAGGGVSVEPAAGASSLPRPLSEGDIREALAQSGMTASTTQATLTPNGLAVAPINAPAAVQAVIAAGNQIAHLPYRYGGGHTTYEDTSYDCSGSISYVFAAAHLLDHIVVSGALQGWGQPGPGKWITVFANAGHTFMYVAGLRFDTVALAETGSRWSDRSANEPDLKTFAVRHPPGL
ncbi:MAG: hypothetical protein ACJ780_16505 [Solirubrobacteraceae bacterium]